MNGMLINILVIVALLASALYSIRLNKKISEMRTALRDMESLFKDFGAQVDRSQSLLADMKAAGEHIATVLDEGVFEAEKINSRLSLTLDRAHQHRAPAPACSTPAKAPAAPPPSSQASPPSPTQSCGHQPGFKKVLWPLAQARIEPIKGANPFDPASGER
jgi:hypothetical protein